MPRGLCQDTDVFGVPGLVDRQLEYRTDSTSLIQLRPLASGVGPTRSMNSRDGHGRRGSPVALDKPQPASSNDDPEADTSIVPLNKR